MDKTVLFTPLLLQVAAAAVRSWREEKAQQAAAVDQAAVVVFPKKVLVEQVFQVKGLLAVALDLATETLKVLLAAAAERVLRQPPQVKMSEVTVLTV